MIETPRELAFALGQRIKARRLAMGFTQADAAARAGVAYRTWRRLESEGKASIEDLVRAAIALRCERDLAALFPEPAATSMDALLQQQRAAQVAAPKRRLRAPPSKASS
ncbi:MAG: helix-turn-helix domain-containing protein [Sphingomonas sp.]|uniref:helix-turn-helix domain-containing protein n=1 Tax=Sphingomonas sp. TaxID=28214 RepID=UPI0025DE4EDC|nr:helix-turn-helix domain-containing protein [Sphingomonas sp.]MBY0283595.1 helix-turn-helix domain-containing protein [Sphingomonas sp.]